MTYQLYKLTAIPIVTKRARDHGGTLNIYIYLRAGKHAKTPVNFISYISQVTAFPKLLLPDHIMEVVMKSQY